MSLRWLACSITLTVLCCSCERSSGDGAKPDASIYNELTHIQAIDNHAHPSKMLAHGELDVDADALPPDAISDLALPTPMLEGSPLIYPRHGTLCSTTRAPGRSRKCSLRN